MEEIKIPKVMDDWEPAGTRTTEQFTVTLPGGTVFQNVPCKDPVTGGDVGEPRGIGTLPRSAQQTLLGLEPVSGDPNSTEPHTDVIKEALRFKAESVIASDQDREQARALLKQLYPKEF